MSDFEKKYYEAEEFWTEGALDDESTRNRIKVTAEMIPTDVTSVCDVGCGNGIFGNYLVRVRPDLTVLSIDRSETALSFVHTEKKVGSIENIPSGDRTFDCVTCLQVLEHLPVTIYQKALNELARVARRYILVSVPYNENLKKNTTECPQCLSVFNADLHLRSYTHKDVQNLFLPFGFKSISEQNIFPISTYAGVGAYYKARSIFHHKEKPFHSPICPICGYENSEFKYKLKGSETENRHSATINSSLSKIKALVKAIWPKKQLPGYWIVAIYERI